MRARRVLTASVNAGRRKPRFGVCPICRRRSIFLQIDDNIRESLLCVFCRSIPRGRALCLALERIIPHWRELSVYEAGAGGAFSEHLDAFCRHFTKSLYRSTVPKGQLVDGIRTEDLEDLTFPSDSFDVVVTQDVLEHVLTPEKAFAEVARVLRPAGVHLFTVPYNPSTKSSKRAERATDGSIRLLAPAQYHGDPLNPGGVLVATDWGVDLPEFVYGASGLKTDRISICDPRSGVVSPVDVFVSRASPRMTD